MRASRKYRSTSKSPLNPYPPCTWTAQSVTRWAIWAPHGLVPAVPFLADEVLLWDAAVLERQVRGGARAQSELRRRLDVGDLETGCILRHQEERDALVALRPRLPRVHLDVVGDAPVRDEPFLAVQHPFVSVEARGRREIPCVAPRLGFRDRPRPEPLPLREGHEPGLLLRLRAEPHEGRLAQGCLDRDRRPHGRRAAADLLDEQHERDVVHAGPAVLLGHGSAEETESRHLAVEGLRDLAFLLPVPNVRDELAIDEIPRGVADEPLLFRQPKVHRAASRGLSCAIRINLRSLRGGTGSAISGSSRSACAGCGSPKLGRAAGRGFCCRPC